MLKVMPFLILFCSNLFAADTNTDVVKINVATQTYQCTITQNLSCTPVNQVEQKVMEINKNGGKVSIADAPKGLSVDLVSSVTNGNIFYDITLCSSKACSLNNVAGGATGSIAQTMFGQYNITEKSFYVIGVSFNTTIKLVDFESKIHNLK
jgi:hypothetical protein